ncbi:MAG: hypothetical protein ACREQ9_00965, partial [Candidatus Binatia bacterium]
MKSSRSVRTRSSRRAAACTSRASRRISAASGVTYTPIYDAEKATSFELGGKSTLLGGAMMLNVTGFWSLLEDLQVR